MNLARTKNCIKKQTTMKCKQLFLSLLLCMIGAAAWAQTDAEYSAALTNITDGNYRIYAESGGTKYYLKVDNPSGKETNLAVTTTSADEATIFAVSQVDISGLKEKSWLIAKGDYAFTNPSGGNGSDATFGQTGYLRGYQYGARKSDQRKFDRQVIYYKDGACAVRSTNNEGTAWGSSAYWGLVTYEGTANSAGYVADAAYIWKFEEVKAESGVTPDAGYYRIYGCGSQAKSYLVADGTNNVKGTGTNVAYGGTDNADVWQIAGTGGTGTIKSLSAGTYVNIDASAEGAGLAYLSATAQELAFTKNPDGTWYIGANDTKAYRYLNFNKNKVNVWSEDANDAVIFYPVSADVVEGKTVSFALNTQVATGGTITISVTGSDIGSIRKNAYVIYQFTPKHDGIYEGFATYATKSDGSSLCFDMDVDLGSLQARDADPVFTKPITNTGGWSEYTGTFTAGSFKLQKDKTYYLRLYFLQEGGSYVCNINQIGIKMVADQTTTDYEVVDIQGYGTANTLYANDFEGKTVYPFWRGWAWDPNYIHVENGYAEFYYNQEAYNADKTASETGEGKRQLKGAELTCGFTTTSEGWYGFRFYLPEGKFAKDITGSIISQIFNRGNDNSWAGHLSLANDKLIVSYRNGLVDPETKVVGTVEWDKWIPVVMYFKAGHNNKGQIKVWMGDKMSETTPTITADGINLGFGNWKDDNTLDSADNEAAEYQGASLGCKFGLYVSDTHDRTIRMDDIKALEGNPSGAFETVKPTLDPTGIEMVHGERFMVNDAQVYDLQGRRVAQPAAKGIYIINGKKIIK